jgi:phosphatidylserine decarboxylase
LRKRFLRTKVEEWTQAWKIHGGVVRLCAAALGVRLSRVRIPSKRLRLLIYRAVYGRKYTALDESEFERPMWTYPSFNALFTRGVRPECRPISTAADQFLCPCDGRVQEVGRFEKDRLVTVKGVEYTLSALLPGVDAGRFRDGPFAILFLSPSDCHRIFAPQDGHVEEVVHVPGYRLLVHPPFQRKEYPVFALNERVIFRLTTPLGHCILVMVAGWGVGNIKLRFDPSFRPRATRSLRQRYTPPVSLKKGEWIATFELGSTAILITEPAEGVTAHVARDEQVKYGQPLFSCPPGAGPL